MSRTVHCKKYDRAMEGLEKPPFPGPRGQEIYETVSAKAWSEWQAHQTMLINERQLKLFEPESRQFLEQQRDKFLAGEEYARAEGYVPPEST